MSISWIAVSVIAPSRGALRPTLRSQRIGLNAVM